MSIRKRVLIEIAGLLLAVLAMLSYILFDFWMFFSVLFSLVGFGMIGFGYGDYELLSNSKKHTRNFLLFSLIIFVFGCIVASFPLLASTVFFTRICYAFFRGMALEYFAYMEPMYDGGVIATFLSLAICAALCFAIFHIVKDLFGGVEKAIALELESKECYNNQANSIRHINSLYDDKVFEFTKKFGVLTKNIPYFYQSSWEYYYQVNYQIPLMSLNDKRGEWDRNKSNVPLVPKEEYGRQYRKIEKSFMVFESTSTIFMEGHSFKFEDIISFEVFDDSRTIYSESSSISSTNTGSMVGRAIVGGILLGGVGAIIGGANAKKEIETSEQESFTSHNYEIVITMNSLLNPIVKISLLEQISIMQEIASILAVIVERNRRQ